MLNYYSTYFLPSFNFFFFFTKLLEKFEVKSSILGLQIRKKKGNKSTYF